jgi:hypothetical protein
MAVTRRWARERTVAVAARALAALFQCGRFDHATAHSGGVDARACSREAAEAAALAEKSGAGANRMAGPSV